MYLVRYRISIQIYRVPVLKVQSYTLEEIKEKHLCVLIPFLPLRFRERLNSSGKKASQGEQPEEKIPKDELTDFYQQIILILEEEVAGGYLTESNRKAILSLLNKSMIRVFYKNDALLKEVITMTEPILELEFEKVERLEKEVAAKNQQILSQQEELNSKQEEINRLKRELAKHQS